MMPEFTLKARDGFHLMLLQQELNFYLDHPSTYSDDDFDALVKRRGFNVDEIASLKQAIIDCGILLWEKC